MPCAQHKLGEVAKYGRILKREIANMEV